MTVRKAETGRCRHSEPRLFSPCTAQPILAAQRDEYLLASQLGIEQGLGQQVK